MYYEPKELGLETLENMLKDVYEKYGEWETFDKMVNIFANDDFYHYHLVAIRYLELKNI